MPSEFRPFFEAVQAKAGAPTPGSFAPINRPPPPVPEPPPAPCGEVKVELKRDGDRVAQIRVVCRCGEVIDLACEY